MYNKGDLVYFIGVSLEMSGDYRYKAINIISEGKITKIYDESCIILFEYATNTTRTTRSPTIVLHEDIIGAKNVF